MTKLKKYIYDELAATVQVTGNYSSFAVQMISQQ